MKDKWEQKWDKECGYYFGVTQTAAVTKEFAEAAEEQAKDFIKDLLKETISKKELPMGLSQWKNHGIKLGYWKYFEKDYVSKKELQEKLETHMKTSTYDDNEDAVFRTTISEIKTLLCK